MRDISQLLFNDLKSDEEKSAFFLSGRAYETGVVASTIQNELAMAYHRIVELKKELAEAQKVQGQLLDALTSVMLCEFNSMSSRAEMVRIARAAIDAAKGEPHA